MKQRNIKKLAVILMLMSFIFATVSPAMAAGLVKITDIQGGGGGSVLNSATGKYVASNNAKTIYFGNYWQSYKGSGDQAVLDNYNKEGIKWRVLSNSGGKTFLLSDHGLYADQFHSDGNTNTWASSEICATLNNTTAGSGFAGDAFSAKEYAAIAETALSDVSSTDKIFLLSTDEAQKTGYGFVTGISANDTRKATATAMAQNVPMYGNAQSVIVDGDKNSIWWLRTQGSSNSSSIVFQDGSIGDACLPGARFVAARPALNLKQDDVLFVSAAEATKSDGVNYDKNSKSQVGVGDGFALANYDGSNGWKLTLKDATIATPNVTQAEIVGSKKWDVNDLAETAKSGTKIIEISDQTPTGSVELQIAYNGAATGANMYVSALLKDGSGNYVNYAKVSSNLAADTKTIDVSGITAADYTLCIYGEQENGNYLTDYASALSTHDITISETVNKILSSAYAAEGLTAKISNGLELGFESGEYDTAVTIEDGKSGKITADETNGTTLKGNVTVGEGATLTTKNSFTLKGNNSINGLFTNEDDVTATLTLAEGTTTIGENGKIQYHAGSDSQIVIGENATLTTHGGGIVINMQRVTNNGTVNITGGELITRITGGTINVTGDVTASPGKLRGETNNVAENATLTLKDGELGYAIGGKGKIIATDDIAIFAEIGTDLTVANTVPMFIISKVPDPSMEGKAGAVKGKLTVAADNSSPLLVNGGALSGGVVVEENSTFSNVKADTPIRIGVVEMELNGNITSKLENSGTFNNGGLISGDVTNKAGATFINNCDMTDTPMGNLGFYTGTITGTVKNEGSFTTDADKILGSVKNSNLLTLTGGVADETISEDKFAKLGSDVTGEGTTIIDGYVNAADKKLETAITVNADKGLYIKADGIKKAVANEGLLLLSDGTLAQNITGNGDTSIRGNVEIGAEINQDNIVVETGSLTTNANLIKGGLINNETVNFTGGTLEGRYLSIDGTTNFKGKTTFNSEVSLANSTVNFYLDGFAKGDTIVTSDKPVALEGAEIELYQITDTDHKLTKDGDKITLISSAEGYDYTEEDPNFVDVQGGMVEDTYGVYQSADGALEAAFLESGIIDETKSFSEARLAGLAAINSGSDLIATEVMENATAETKEWQAFAAIGGSHGRYNTGSHVDLNSLNVAAGLSKKVKDNVTLGIFVEGGNGRYTTYNEFEEGDVRADGDINYFGGGVFAKAEGKKTAKGQLHGEASFRVGHMNSDYNSENFAEDETIRFDTSNAYLGIHAGLGYKWALKDNSNIDTYVKYLWNRQNSDSPTIAGEKFDLDAINSHRLRMGFRYNSKANDKGIKFYGGLAYEYEFDGVAKGRMGEYALLEPDYKGGSGIAEIGFKYHKANSPWKVDLGLTGATGKRDSIGINLGATYEFGK